MLKIRLSCKQTIKTVYVVIITQAEHLNNELCFWW